MRRRCLPKTRALGRGGGIDEVGRVAEVLADQLTLGLAVRFDDVTGLKAVLCADAGVER